MFTQTIGDTAITVDYIGKAFEPGGSWRRNYGYSIVTSEWRYDGNDIHSGVGAAIDVEDAARVLFSFLSACAESRDYRDSNGSGGENAELFPEHVGQWAQDNSDDITMLSLNPSDWEE